jgi:hypothetical protein
VKQRNHLKAAMSAARKQAQMAMALQQRRSRGRGWCVGPGPKKLNPNSQLFWFWFNQKATFQGSKILNTKYWAVGIRVKNNFPYWHLVPFSTESELKFRFHPGFEFDDAGDLSNLCTLMQLHHDTNLDNECSKLIYKYFSMI